MAVYSMLAAERVVPSLGLYQITNCVEPLKVSYATVVQSVHTKRSAAPIQSKVSNAANEISQLLTLLMSMLPSVPGRNADKKFVHQLITN